VCTVYLAPTTCTPFFHLSKGIHNVFIRMPFTVDDVSRSESEIAASEAKDIQTAHKRVGQVLAFQFHICFVLRTMVRLGHKARQSMH
jgi:hypothetical protein